MSSSLSDFEPKKEVIETVIKNTGQDKITLIKNTKGYNWEISSYADNMNDAIDKAIAADLRLKKLYGGGLSE